MQNTILNVIFFFFLFSHLLLVINSSINMILYIFLNESFRRHFVDLVYRYKERVTKSGRICKNTWTKESLLRLPWTPAAEGMADSGGGGQAPPVAAGCNCGGRFGCRFRILSMASFSFLCLFFEVSKFPDFLIFEFFLF